MSSININLQYLKWLNIVGVSNFCSNKIVAKRNLFKLSKQNMSIQKDLCQSPVQNVHIQDVPIKDLINKPNSITSKMQQNISGKYITQTDLKQDDSATKIQANVESLNKKIVEARKLADLAIDLKDLKDKICGFDECDLKKFAKNTVFADGTQDAKIMLIGEAPGATEDDLAIPFCGESGQLLDKIFASIGLSRTKNLYITNTVFWRPPANRTPSQEEIDICKPFVEKHISLQNPDLIILVGNTAATSLLGKHQGITNLRRNIFAYSNKYLKKPINLTAIFHPAYLLRQPGQKKQTWFDMLFIEKLLKSRI